jgi:hypothetical protein
MTGELSSDNHSLPLTEQALRALVEGLERELRETWAVHVALTGTDPDHPFEIVKIEPWSVTGVKVSRHGTYDIHRVQAADELGAYATMRRTLAKLEPPKCS